MNWSNKLSKCWVAECLTATRETKQRQRAQRRVRDEMWGEVESLCFGVCVKWAEVGFRYKSNGAFSTFFFFFFEFRPESSVSADMARVGPISRESARDGAASACVGVSRLKTRGIHVAQRGGTRPDAWATASLARHRVPPRRTLVRHLWCRVCAS